MTSLCSLQPANLRLELNWHRLYSRPPSQRSPSSTSRRGGVMTSLWQVFAPCLKTLWSPPVRTRPSRAWLALCHTGVRSCYTPCSLHYTLLNWSMLYATHKTQLVLHCYGGLVQYGYCTAGYCMMNHTTFCLHYHTISHCTSRYHSVMMAMLGSDGTGHSTIQVAAQAVGSWPSFASCKGRPAGGARH